jgi:hypothetical protein
LRGIKSVRLGLPTVYQSTPFAQEITMTRTAQLAHRPAAAAKPRLAASQGAAPGVELAQGAWSSLLAMQATLAGEQWTQALQDMSALVEQAIEVENRWIARSYSDASRLSQHWLGNGAYWAPGLRDVEAVETATPLAMIGQAQAMLNEVSRLWAPVLYDTHLPD